MLFKILTINNLQENVKSGVLFTFSYNKLEINQLEKFSFSNNEKNEHIKRTSYAVEM